MKIILAHSKKNTGRCVFLIVFVLTVLMLISASVLVLARIKPVFKEKVLHAARIKAIEIVNTAVNDVFDECGTEDFVRINSDGSGNVMSVSADSVQMNKLKSKVAVRISEYAEESDGTYIYIPVGSLTKYPVFQGIGYRIPVRISLDAAAKVDFDDEFTSAGINQVKHKIFLTAETEVYAVSAAMTVSENISAQIPVAETVIVGDVPNYYGDNLSVVGK